MQAKPTLPTSHRPLRLHVHGVQGRALVLVLALSLASLSATAWYMAARLGETTGTQAPLLHQGALTNSTGGEGSLAASKAARQQGRTQSSPHPSIDQSNTTAVALPLPPTQSPFSLSPAPLGPSPLPPAAHPRTLLLTEALYNLTLSNPALLETPAVLAAFRAAPWLLPCGHTAGLPYASASSRDLDSLLQTQSLPVAVTMPAAAVAVPEEWLGGVVAVPIPGTGASAGAGAGTQLRVEFPRAVSLLLFSWHYAVVVQNYIYGLVRHAGAPNCIVVVWEERSLEACLALHLPCYDASHLLPQPLGSPEEEALFGTSDFHVIGWLKPLLLCKLLEQGFLVHMSDADVAYSHKDLWRSYLTYILEAGAAAAMQAEFPVNTGNLVVLPTPQGLDLAQAWREFMPFFMAHNMSDQEGLSELAGWAYTVCNATVPASECQRVAAVGSRLGDGGLGSAAGGSDSAPALPLVRLTSSAFEEVFGDGCAAQWPENITRVEVCSPAHDLPAAASRAGSGGQDAISEGSQQGGASHLYFHPICITGAEAKAEIFRRLGYWFIDDDWCHPACSSRVEQLGSTDSGGSWEAADGGVGNGGSTSGEGEGQVSACLPLEWRLPEEGGVVGEGQKCAELAFHRTSVEA